MAGKNFIPTKDLEFMEWLENLLKYASLHYTKWNLGDPENVLAEPLADLKAKLAKTSDPNCGKVDLFATKESRKKTEKIARSFVQGFLAKNPFVTAEDRMAMGLPIYDAIPTSVADPTGQAEANISYPGRTQLMLHIKHVAGTPYDANANYGYRIYYGIPDAGDPPPQGYHLRESKFTRKKKELFSFHPNDSGKTAYFCIRYENSKGAAGPWGPVAAAVIP